MNRAKLMSGFALLVAFVIFLVGCSSGLDDAPKVDNLLGSHPTEWVRAHWLDSAKNKSIQCEPCHGSITDRALAGGISKVSCFSCHTYGVRHTVGFVNASRHGRNAAQEALGVEPTSMFGFASCQRCHGDDYRGGEAVSCMSCHNRAPHPNRPWTGSNPAVVTHAMTADGNAPACARCHTDGANSTLVPDAPPVPGAPPGCFNNTLCHAQNV
jgi:cytochrome c553